MFLVRILLNRRRCGGSVPAGGGGSAPIDIGSGGPTTAGWIASCCATRSRTRNNSSRCCRRWGAWTRPMYCCCATQTWPRLKRGLADLGRRVKAASRREDRLEVLLYYSGHADEGGPAAGRRPPRLSAVARLAEDG